MIEIEFLHIIGIIGLFLGGRCIFIVRSHILKLVLFSFWYPLLTMMLFAIGMPLGGSIDVIGKPIYYEYALDAFFFALTGFFLLFFSVWNLRSRKFKIRRLNLTEGMRLFFVFILLFVSFVAYPKAWGLSESRWNLLPGQWSVVYLALNAILILSLRTLKSVTSIIHLLILILVVKGGERVDSIMSLFLLFYLHCDSPKEYLTEGRISFGKGILGILVIILGISVGYTRVGNSFSLPILFQNIVALHTVRDVVHVYFSSFYYISKNGINLSPLVNELFSLVPFHPWGGAGNQFNFTEVLRKVIYNNGGGLFYTEGVLLIGKMGVLIYSFLLGQFMQFIFRNKHQAGSVVAIIFLILLLRVQWYGIVYLYTPIILTILIVGFYNIVKLLIPKKGY